MRFQDYIIETTREAAKEAFNYASKVPADKLDWKPSGEARSVLDQCQELAICPKWAIELLGDGPMPEWSEEMMAETEKEKAQFDTLEKCRVECERRLEEFAEFMKNYPDEKLENTKWLPFGGGRDYTMKEIADYPRWNFTYHLGQISYIQLMYGDKEMY